LRETDLNEVVKTVENVLPQYVNGDIDVTITLLEKNLKIMADMARMRETLTHLIENAMDAVPGYGRFSLTVNQEDRNHGSSEEFCLSYYRGKRIDQLRGGFGSDKDC
jgi:nitrogen fixation/metabolism regulation signal transduction histidine kinase